MSQTKLSALRSEYDPGKLLTEVMEQQGLSSYARLADLLGVDPTTLSSIKLRKLALSQKLLNRIQEVSGLSICEMRDLMDDRRRDIRMAKFAD
jgi:plasmid maintenance system antidote protein VapI